MSFGSIFKKIGRSVGNVFKKGTRAIGNIAKREVERLPDALPSLGSLGGSVIGADLGEMAAIGIDQPELVPIFGAIGGKLGSMAGKELGKLGRDRIRRPLPRGSVGGSRLGADPRTYTPRTRSNPNENVDRGVPLVVKKTQPRNELERMKQMREPKEKIRFN